MNNQSPYENMLEEPREGIVSQELHTYSIKNGMVTKTVVTRTFFNNDYTDSKQYIPIVEIK